MSNLNRTTQVFLITLVALFTGGCDGVTNQRQYLQPTAASGAPNPASGQNEVFAAQNARARKVELTVDARVYKLLPDDTKGLPHQRFLLWLNNGTTLLVAHDTLIAPRVPVQEGDLVRIHGEYIFNEKGGVIHFTHHASRGAHEGGWIECNGLRYQ